MKKVLQSWLFHQCRIIAGSIRAVLLTGPPGEGPHDQALIWPDKRRNHSVLLRDAEAALRNEQALVITRNNKGEKAGEPPDTLTCPLFLNDRLFGAVAIEMTHRAQPMQQETVQQIQTGALWLETMIQLQGSTPELISFALNRKNGSDCLYQLLGGLKAPDIKNVPDLAEPALNALTIYRTSLGAVKDAWPAASQAVTRALTDPALKANIYGSYKPAKNHPEHTQRELRVRILIEAMDNLADPMSIGFPLFRNFERYTTTKLVKSTKKNHRPLEHDFFDLCDDLFRLEAQLNLELETYLADPTPPKQEVVEDLRPATLYHAPAKQQLVNLVDLVAAGLEHEQFRVAATEVASELAERFSCQRVSLGFLQFSRVRVVALSHGYRVDQQSNQIRAIQDAMGEALDQGTTVVYPVESDDIMLITRFHAQLANEEQGAAICTLPLIKNSKAVGALLLERVADKPFTAETVAQCEQISLLLGPVLETRRRDERPLPLKILDSMQSWCAKLFGPRHLQLKVGLALSVMLLIWLSQASATFSISSDSVLEAEICRTVVAPQAGYIAEAYVRAGDRVREGDLLATLEDQELRYELRKWQSKRTQLLKEYRKALAGSDRAEVAILNAKRAQTEAQLKLVELQLSRAKLVAPFSGLVVKGDLNQALGSPVKRGEVLFEISPTNDYRVVLKVDDRDIGLVSLGQQGQLKLSGIPDRSVIITIDRLTPVSSSTGGRNYFRVEAVMDKHLDLMRPGMEGITKIDISQEKLLWIWTRRLVDWLRLFVWSRLP
jgi:multidrug resistance efflux pump